MRKASVLFVALATALAMAMPIVQAEESDVGEFDSSAPVEKGDYNSYIVVMDDAPLVADYDREDLDSSAAEADAAELEETHEEVLEEEGLDTGDIVHNYVNALNGFSARLTHAEAEQLAANPKVALVMPDELQQPDTDSSPSFLGLDGDSPNTSAWAAGYTGDGVVVGVIDTGIWPEHPSFADNGMPAPPIDTSSLDCDFGNTAHNANDAPFTCQNKLLGARQMLSTYRAVIGADPDEYDSARDDDGHGTHTASTAAGNAGVQATAFGEDVAVISGIAPDAHVIAYKGLGKLGGFTSDLAAAIDQAVADGVDVINYSIGGGASLTGADELAFLFAADAGVYVATSAGNSGPGDATVGGPGTVPWMTTVGASTQERFFQGTLLVRVKRSKSSIAEGKSKYKRVRFRGASLTPGTEKADIVDAADAGNELCLPGTLDPAVVSGNIVLCKRGGSARADKGLAVSMAGGVGMVMYNTSDVDNLFTDVQLVPSVHIDYTPGIKLKDLIASGRIKNAKIITGQLNEWDPAPSMTIFSSRGPNSVASDIIKPDVTAPGMQILAGASPINYSTNTAQGQLFQSIAGTSMSSPHVAGLFALIKEAHPDWSAAAAKSALMTTAHQDVRDNDRTSRAGVFDMGAGHVDPGGTNPGSAFNPGLVYDAGFNEYLGFLCDAEPTIFVDPAGTCASLESLGIPTDASDLNLASIGVGELAGSQTVTRTVTSVANRTLRYRVSVDAPDGYEVEVSPSTIRIAPGQTVSYEVTINNVSAPIGVWRSGSLTWKASHYEVYSPIAVNAALFDSPSTVDGAGEAGSASFDVTFGYTGTYSAAAHGLEPATVINDNVAQDPDQAFDPTDGFSDAHTFDLSGSAFFKIAMPPDAVPSPDVDIDIFVYDPSGVQVASSTSGGTDEVIEIPLPADGTWTVYVHGWQTVTPTVDYTLYAWDISLTPGGNLMVDAAPGSATIGTTSSIDVSWTGATTGEWHLGAVSHTGDVGLMGLTLVEVDNR